MKNNLLVTVGVKSRAVVPMTLFLLMAASTSVFATTENPHQEFSTGKNNTNKSTITWRPVENVQAECDKESKRLGHGGFGYPVEACSFWEKTSFNNACTIISSKTVNFHTVGHEVRHCFQGNFH